MEGAGPPARAMRSSVRRARSRPANRATWSPRSQRCRPPCGTNRRRWSTRGPPTASAATHRSRGRACVPVTCRAPSMPSSAMIDNGTLASPARLGQAFAEGGSISTSRSSPVAAPASLPPRPGSRSTRSARNREAFTTVHGRNGGRGAISRSSPSRKPDQMARSKAPVALVTEPPTALAGRSRNDCWKTVFAWVFSTSPARA